MNKLDLNKLEEKLDTALENETGESLTSWLTEKRIFEKVEWVMQFDDDEPIVIARMGDTKGDEKEYLIKIGNDNHSNIWFADGKGKGFKIFAREIK